MPSYMQHIEKALSNADFLCMISFQNPQYLDWEVTSAFYSGLHFINAHLAQNNGFYQTHSKVRSAINPKKGLNTSVPPKIFFSYEKLKNLSRRSRYLSNDKNPNSASEEAFFTYEIHLEKAIYHLDIIMQFINETYGLEYTKMVINNRVNTNCIYFEKSKK